MADHTKPQEKTGGNPITQADLDKAVADAAAQAKADSQAAFNKQLKEVAGVDSLDALAEANKKAAEDKAKADGEFEKLANQSAKERDDWKSKFQASTSRAAILSAATDSVDPDAVHQLLAASAAVSDAGEVTIDGKPVKDAVATLLKDKPYLAKASGKTGSGSPAGGQGDAKTITRDAFEKLDPSARSKFVADGGRVTD